MMKLAKNNEISKTLLNIFAALVIFFLFGYTLTIKSTTSLAAIGCGCPQPCICGCTCTPWITNCGTTACTCQSNHETPITIKHITDEFIQHREWLIKIVWEAHVLPAMMLMTEQISALAIQQTMIIGSFFDAKQQLETQQLLQSMQAEAHKQYQPSEGMCKFGTTTRSLAAASRNTSFTQAALAARSLQRQLLSGDVVSAGSRRDDSISRLDQLKKTYCNPKDFGNNMSDLCKGTDKKRYNRDIDFSQTIDAAHNLQLDFTKPDATADSEDVFALSSNLYGSTIMPRIPEDKMSKDGAIIDKGALVYMKMRSLIAKRSVAQAAYAAQAAMKAQGEDKVQPYLDAILKEMGIEEQERIAMLGNKPSYDTQMEILTKKLYQTPNFYAELYDKPTNIDRKNVSMQAIDSMQRRDMYNSQQRAEAISAVWLEMALEDLEKLYVNETRPLTANSKPLDLPGLN